MTGRIARLGRNCCVVAAALTASAALPAAQTWAQAQQAPSTAIQNQPLAAPPNTDESKVLGTAAPSGPTAGGEIAPPVTPPAPEAAPPATATIPASTDWVQKTRADLIVLDKIYGSARTVQAAVGTPFTERFLTITVLACFVRPPNLAPDAAVFLQVTDTKASAGTPPKFRGWVFEAEPALSGMADPATDVSVTGCN